MTDDQPSLGEIGRSVDRLEKEIGGVRGDIKQLEEKVPTREFIEAMERAFLASLSATETKWSTKIEHIEDKIADLESWKTWTLRLVVGAILMAILGLVVISGPK